MKYSYSALDFAIHGLEPGDLSEALAAHKQHRSRWIGSKLQSQRVWASSKGNGGEYREPRGSSLYELEETPV
jgi:hypothetical protein